MNVQMKNAGIIDSATFMLCLGMENGQIIFGGYSKELLYDQDIGIQWIPTVNDYSYSIKLDNLYVGNIHIPHSPPIAFIDSGSSLVQMSYEFENHILESFDQF